MLASGEACQDDNADKYANPKTNQSNTAPPSATNNTDDAANKPAPPAVKPTQQQSPDANTTTNHDTVAEQLKTPAPLHMAGGPFQHAEVLNMHSVRQTLNDYQPHQNCETKTLRALITRRGHKQFAIWCNCGNKPKRGTWIPHRIVTQHAHSKGLTIDDIPTQVDNTCNHCNGTGCNTCETEPCERCGSFQHLEIHHWAPWHLFNDADKWPTSTLCRTCHKTWHSTVTPQMQHHTS